MSPTTAEFPVAEFPVMTGVAVLEGGTALALSSHLRFALHHEVSATCPVCTDLVRHGALIEFDDGWWRPAGLVRTLPR